ncbi:MAG: hydroxyisourate hydrolase [Proteobacteria bacterium]|nr:hydroxyisourate hydrolase [Pseudomonadota bacterium]
MSSPITTHVLDTALGSPAQQLHICLDRVLDDGSLERVARGATNQDGRITDLMEPGQLHPGIYQMTFETAAYFERTGREYFYPQVDVRFWIKNADEHYHVPLLLSPFGFSTYRGS